MTDALQAVDDRASAVAKAPRITKEFIESQIKEKVYSTADALVPSALKDHYAHLTLCIIRVNNGFMVVGESAPMSPENFDAELGQQLAYENAFRKLWPLYAFTFLEDEWLCEQEASNPHGDGETSSPNSPAPGE